MARRGRSSTHACDIGRVNSVGNYFKFEHSGPSLLYRPKLVTTAAYSCESPAGVKIMASDDKTARKTANKSLSGKSLPISVRAKPTTPGIVAAGVVKGSTTVLGSKTPWVLQQFNKEKDNKLSCKHCLEVRACTNITRLKNHLLHNCCSKTTGEGFLHSQQARKLVNVPEVAAAVKEMATSSGKVSSALASSSRSTAFNRDVMTGATKELVDKAFMDMLIACAMAFHIVEAKETIAFFKLLRPAWQLPSRQHIASVLLMQSYAEMQAKVEAKLAAAPYVTLCFDGWSRKQVGGIYHDCILSCMLSMICTHPLLNCALIYLCTCSCAGIWPPSWLHRVRVRHGRVLGLLQHRGG